jgi:hypothetical protein
MIGRTPAHRAARAVPYRAGSAIRADLRCSFRLKGAPTARLPGGLRASGFPASFVMATAGVRRVAACRVSGVKGFA